jgi:hypothetical protein
MKNCTDKQLGRMLHDYELGQLSEEDARRFELHLYECAYCEAQLRDLMYVSRTLIHDQDATRLISSLASEDNQTSMQGGREHWSKATKLLIAAAAVMILAVSSYFYLTPSDTGTVVQTLRLLPQRSAGNDVLYLEKGGMAEISFFASEKLRRSAVIVIAEVGGDTVRVYTDFSDFSSQGIGRLTIPLSELSEGHFTLSIKPGESSAAAPEITYLFRVK